MSRRKKAQQLNTAEAVAVQDAFSNPLYRLGWGSQSPLEATEYPLTRMKDNYALLNSLYRDNWVVQNGVGLMVDDMLREWGDIKGITPEVGGAGERGGAKAASNPIECPAKPCCARRAAREAGTFPLRSSGKVTAFLGCEKV